MALTITAFDANSDGTGIDVAAYLADYDATYAPAGFGWFSNSTTDFSGNNYASTEQTNLIASTIKQSVVFESGGGGKSIDYTFATHTVGGDLDAISFGYGLSYQAGTDSFNLSRRDLRISGLGYVDQFGSGNMVSTLITDAMASNITNLVGLFAANEIIFVGSAGADAFTGYLYNDTLSGGAGNDTLNGGAGNDTLDGGAGDDALNGGSDIDTADYSTATAAVRVSLLTTAQQNTVGAGLDTVSNVENLTGSAFADTLTGSNGVNVLNGGNGNDKLFGRNGNDTLNGGDGNDTLNGGAGNDTMTGGIGNDIYVVDSQNDVIVEVAGGGTADKVTTTVSYTLAAGVDIEILTAVAGSPGLALTGNEIANKIYGADGNDTLDGGGGIDLLVGKAGDDTYVVDNTKDKVTEVVGSGTDTVVASVGFTLGDNVENLALSGSGDIAGNGNALDNTITGNSGINRLSGLDGNDTVDGGGGADTIYGGLGEDELYGGAGDDKVYGGDGADTIVGQGGKDILTGNAGSDVFVYQLLSDSGITGATRDQIVDFQVGVDRIDLSQLDAISGGGDNAFNFVGSGALQNVGDLRAYASGGNTFVAGDVNGDHVVDFQILLQGSVALTGADFIL
jgi:Ca2+-binding RTX toxin-like protein